MQINDTLLDIEGIKKSKLNLIDLFIRRTAVLTSTPEHLVEKIVKDQWANANKMTQPGRDIGEMDFPNLGTFYISKSKANKRIARVKRSMDEQIERLRTQDLDEKGVMRTLANIQKYKESINSMKQKTKIQIQDEVQY